MKAQYIVCLNIEREKRDVALDWRSAPTTDTDMALWFMGLASGTFRSLRNQAERSVLMQSLPPRMRSVIITNNMLRVVLELGRGQ